MFEAMLQPLLEQYGITPDYISSIKDRLENALVTIENMEQDITLIKEKLDIKEE